MNGVDALRSPRVAWAVLLAVIVGVYAYNAPYFGHLNNPNENVRVYMTRAMVEDHTFAIDDIIAEWGYVNDKATFDGRMYAGKAPGMSYLGVPVYAAHYAINQALDRKATKQEIVMVCRVGASVLPLLGFLFWFARFSGRFGAPTAVRMLGVIALALGSTLLTYGGMFASHAMVAACLFGAHMLSFDHRENPYGWRAPFWLGFLLATALALEYPGALGGAVVGLYALYRSPQRGRFFCWSALGMLLPLGLVFLFHWKAFGGPMELPYSHLENPDFVASHSAGFFGMEHIQPVALHGSFFAPSNGLFWFLPWTMIPFVGLVFAMHFRRLREPALVTFATLLVYTMFIAMVDNWRGGWTAGPRYIVPVVPFLAWYMIVFMSELRRTRLGVPVMGLAFGLVAVSMFNCGVSAFVFPHFPEAVSNPIYEIAIHMLQRGFYPHSLGSALGLTGVATLVPLVALHGTAFATALLQTRSLDRLERLTLFAAALTIAGAFALMQSTPRTPTSRNVTGLQATVADLWEPLPTDGVTMLRMGTFPSDVRFRRATAAQLRATAAQAARRGLDETAAALYEAALRAPR